MASATGSGIRELGLRARWRAARAVERSLDRWTSLASLAVGLAGAGTAVAVYLLA